MSTRDDADPIQYRTVFQLSRDSKWKQAIALMLDRKRTRLRPEFRSDGNHAWYVVGDLYWKDGDIGNALLAFRKAVRAWAEDVQALWAVGNCYSALGRHRMAERFFRRALKIDPANPSLAFNLGNSLFDQKRYEEALPAYRLAAKRGSDVCTRAKRNIELVRRLLG